MGVTSFKPKGFSGNTSVDNMRPRGLFDSASGYNPKGGTGWDSQYMDNVMSMLVARPISGTKIKARSPASLMVLKRDGTPVPLLSSTGLPWSMEGGREAQGEKMMGSGGWHEGVTAWGDVASGKKKVSKYYTDFSLVKVEENRAEKLQIAQTFGDDFIFMFGERPRMLSCTGVLVNTRDFEWRSRFWENYEKYLRGTRLVEMDARAYLSWDDVLAEGYILSASALDIAQEPHAIQFSFILLVTSYLNVGSVRGSVIEALADVMDLAKGVAGALSLSLEKQNRLGARNMEGLTSMLGKSKVMGLLKSRQAAAVMGKDNPELAAVTAQLTASHNARESSAALGTGMTAPPPRTAGRTGAPLNSMFKDPAGEKVSHQTSGLANQSNAKKLFGSDHQNVAGMAKVNLPKKA
jgi:hypothetical protein